MRYLIETSARSLNKAGEELCGDRVILINGPGHVTAVLSDGLGSGVKANILATLTGKIAVTMLENGASIDEVVETVGRTLPVCRIRNLAYATFTIIQVFEDGKVYLAEFDNPAVFYLHNKRVTEIPRHSRQIAGRTVQEAHFIVENGDYLVAVSDGVEHAGVGAVLNLGWQWPHIAQYLERQAQADPTAETIGGCLLETCSDLYAGRPGDDASVVALRVRLPRHLTVAIGPPQDPRDDGVLVNTLMERPGKKAVCGGTTASIVARQLNRELTVDLDNLSDNVPPMGRIQGLNLVTEGIITVSRALAQLRRKEPPLQAADKADGATRLSQMLLEADDICFLVGRAINPAHQNPDLPQELALKQQVISDLAAHLLGMGKKVVVHHF